MDTAKPDKADYWSADVSASKHRQSTQRGRCFLLYREGSSLEYQLEDYFRRALLHLICMCQCLKKLRSAQKLRIVCNVKANVCKCYSCKYLASPSGFILTDDGLPFAVGLCDLIGAAHLAERHSTDDEDDDTWPSAVLSRGLILVPVAIPSTARRGKVNGQDRCYKEGECH